jgi:hypothetical protein
MTLDDIFENWTVDSRIDSINLGNASLEVPKLHNKYWKILSHERLIFKKQQTELATLMLNKKAWLNGELTSDVLKGFGWDIQLKKMLKSEQDEFLRADQDVINMNLKMALQQEKIEVVTDIIKSLHNRSFMISNAVKWAQFQSGG